MVDHLETNTFPLPSTVSEPPKGYDLTGKIMLSAIVILFAVIVIMLCLHIYARWYLLRARRRQLRHARRTTNLVFYAEHDDPTRGGLDASVLELLPTFTYRVGEASDDDVEEREKGCIECAVCLSEFEDGEKGRVLPKCSHSFHVECIDMWFHSHVTCPICRAAVDGGDLKPDVRVDSVDSTELSEWTRASRDSDGASRVDEVGGSVSLGGRRKGLDLVSVSIEVPRRAHSFSFTSLDESSSSSSRLPGGFKSPTSRILSLKSILSREKKSALPSPSSVGPSCCESATELDIELGRVEGASQPSPALTPR